MTETMMEIDDGATMVAEFNEHWREGEQALLRLIHGEAIPGDGIRLALDDLGRQERERERLQAVSSQFQRAGSAAEYHAAREEFHEVSPRVHKGLQRCAAELARLASERATIIAEQDALTQELAAAETKLSGMTRARERLRSLGNLPRHIVDEYNARIRSVNNETGARQAQLRELISTLSADGGRLASQTEGNGKLMNENLLEDFASKAASNPNHRAFGF